MTTIIILNEEWVHIAIEMIINEVRFKRIG